MQESNTPTATTTETAAARPKLRRGFASMDPDTLRAVCSQGWQDRPRPWQSPSLQSRRSIEGGQKGGASVAADRTYMATIGQRGGKAKKGYRERQAAQRQAEAETAASV